MAILTKHARSRQLVDDIVRYLASGGTIVLEPGQSDLTSYINSAAKPTGRRQVLDTSRLLRYMRQQNLISVTPISRGRRRVRLAGSGINRAQKITLADMSIPKPNRWDQRWRVVFFDIPESQRSGRNNLVAKLKDLNFFQLQKSVWVHPFPCLIEIEFIKRSFDLGNYVTLAEVDKIDRHQQLVRHFRSLIN